MRRIAEGSDYIKIVYEPHFEGRRDTPTIDRATGLTRRAAGRTLRRWPTARSG